jgi:hypothetical protein
MVENEDEEEQVTANEEEQLTGKESSVRLWWSMMRAEPEFKLHGVTML